MLCRIHESISMVSILIKNLLFQYPEILRQLHQGPLVNRRLSREQLTRRYSYKFDKNKIIKK